MKKTKTLNPKDHCGLRGPLSNGRRPRYWKCDHQADGIFISSRKKTKKNMIPSTSLTGWGEQLTRTKKNKATRRTKGEMDKNPINSKKLK
jgi:hypothetical protein